MRHSSIRLMLHFPKRHSGGRTDCRGGRISFGMSTKRIEMGRGHVPLTTIKKFQWLFGYPTASSIGMESVSLRHQDFHGSPDSAIMPLRNNVGINPPWVSWLKIFTSHLFSSREKHRAAIPQSIILNVPDEDSSRFQLSTFGRSSYIKHVSQPLGLPRTDLGHRYISDVYLVCMLNHKWLSIEKSPTVSDECLEYSF